MKNMMKNNILLAIGFLMCFVLGCIIWYGTTPPNIVGSDTVWSTKTDTIWKDTTITKIKQVPKEVIKIRVDTFYTKDGNDTILTTENKIYKDTLCQQNDTAIVTSYIKGINASLDSTKVQLKTSKEIITNTIEITKYIEKKKTIWDRFSIGLSVGYGYGFKNKDIEPFVGGAVTYSF